MDFQANNDVIPLIYIQYHSLSPRLQNIGEEECPAQRHVVQMQQCCPIGEDWVDVDLLDVGEVGDAVVGQLQLADVFDGAVVLIHLGIKLL